MAARPASAWSAGVAGGRHVDCLPVWSRFTLIRSMPTSTYELSHLRALEAEAIHIIREVAAEFERPGLLFSGRQGLDRDAAPGGEGLLAGPRARSR